MRPSTMQVPLCINFLAEVWWLLGLEERRKGLWLHTLLGSTLCPACPSFVGGRKGWGQPNHLWVGSQGWPCGAICFVWRWYDCTPYIFSPWKRLVDALVLPHSPCLSSVLSCVAHGRKSPNIQSCLPRGLVSALCQGAGAMASLPEQPLLSPCLQVHLAWSTHRWSKR